MEEFRDIPGYEGHYQVSNLGRVKSIRFGKERILQPGVCFGYYQICLIKNTKKLHTRIHRLVCLVFLENPENKKEVNHKNGIRNDNRLENLEWVTRSENMMHSYKVLGNKGPMLGKLGILNNLSKKVNQYDLQNNFIKTWNYMSEVERILGIGYTNISACCRGKTKTAGGYIWKYEKI